MRYKVNQRDLKQLDIEIDRAVDDSTEDSYEYFKSITPKREGNARRNTKYRESNTKAVINADYPYADRLDKGWSKQAPKGMSEPTLKFLEKTLKKKFKRI